jgi:squalene-hopene/tetraprenyl-beta-curcumene cyclase
VIDTEPADGTTAGQPAQSAMTIAAATKAVERAARLLLARQDSGGWWNRRPEGDVAIDVEGLLLREFLGIRTPELTNVTAQVIRSLQRTDGSWAPSAGTPEHDQTGSLSLTVLAYVALRLAGDSADAYHMAIAAGWIRDKGGIRAVDVFTQTWLACFGLAEWEAIHVPSPEVFYLPARHGFGMGEWASRSRIAAVSLAVIGAVRPLRGLPFDVSALAVADGRIPPQRSARRIPTAGPARAVALRRCGQWIISWQERDGRDRPSPAPPYALLALHLLGYSLRHPVLAGGLAWLDSVTTPPRASGGHTRTTDVMRSPLRDTALAIRALADAGLAGDHPSLTTAGNWVLARCLHGPKGRAATPSGWSFGGDGYPAVADTALVLLALARVRLPAGTIQPAVTSAVRWLASMQAKDGSWYGSPETTAHVVHALATSGRTGTSQAVRGGVVWLLRAQQPDGSWAGRSEDSTLSTTAIVLPALLAAGVRPSKPVVANAVRWLLDRQNLDAGWGPGLGQTVAASMPSVSQVPATALVAVALLAVVGSSRGEPTAPGVHDSVELAADWLVKAQRPDGGWSARPPGRARQRDSVVGGVLLPLRALGRYVGVVRAAPHQATHGVGAI